MADFSLIIICRTERFLEKNGQDLEQTPGRTTALAELPGSFLASRGSHALPFPYSTSHVTSWYHPTGHGAALANNID